MSRDAAGRAIIAYDLGTGGAKASLYSTEGTCLASTFVVTPKIQAIRARINAPIETLAPDHTDRVAYNRAHSVSRNLFFLRILLALGLAVTVGMMPLTPGRDPK